MFFNSVTIQINVFAPPYSSNEINSLITPTIQSPSIGFHFDANTDNVHRIMVKSNDSRTNETAFFLFLFQLRYDSSFQIIIYEMFYSREVQAGNNFNLKNWIF